MTRLCLLPRPRAARGAFLVLTVLTVLAGACSPAPTPPPAGGDTSNGGPAPQRLWGDMKPHVSVRELMRYMIDPVADNIFNAVGTVITKEGMVDREPRTDEDWEKVQAGAVSLVEGIYLLKVPRPFTPPGDVNNSIGPEAVELSPEQITAKVERDPVEWNARIEATRNAALNVMEIVKRRDAAALWEAGEILDQTCEACHRSYWYPGENAEFYRRLRGRLDRYTQQQSGQAAEPSQKK